MAISVEFVMLIVSCDYTVNQDGEIYKLRLFWLKTYFMYANILEYFILFHMHKLDQTSRVRQSHNQVFSIKTVMPLCDLSCKQGIARFSARLKISKISRVRQYDTETLDISSLVFNSIIRFDL